MGRPHPKHKAKHSTLDDDQVATSPLAGLPYEFEDSDDVFSDSQPGFRTDLMAETTTSLLPRDNGRLADRIRDGK